MALALYNTATRKVAPFTTLKEGEVRMYMCGPTVYNYAHIGNFRSFVLADVLRRVLAYCGYEVKHTMNLTDIDDKTIRDSQKEGKTLQAFTEYYTEKFFEDYDELNCLRPTTTTKATDYIEKMITLVKKLIEKGVAYEKKGSVYYSIEKFADYGALVGLRIDDLQQNADGRLNDDDEYDKENARDFALWKSHEESDGEVWWESPWGRGRPGWHLECSVMSMDTLGETFDIHAGGVDLKFPHHTNEIAQSCAATGKEYAKWWTHFEFLLVEGEKMSKSLGNFYTLRDIMAKGYTGREIRYLLLSTHYRQKLNFTIAGLDGVKQTLSRIDDFLLRMQETNGEEEAKEETNKAKETFRKALEDDMNISGALASMHEYMRAVNKKNLTEKAAQEVLATMYTLDEVLAVGFKDVKKGQVGADIEEKIAQRDEARKNKDWAKADSIRDELAKEGIELYDTPQGTKWRKKE